MRARSSPQSEGYTCFGIPLASTLELPGAWRTARPRADATSLVVGEMAAWSGTGEGGWQGVSDGKTFTVERSQTGEHRFIHGERASFQLSADRRTLTCAPGEPRDLGWWRILMDSVLMTVSLLRGKESVHAGAASTSAGAVAIAAASGGGKSTLLAELLRSGHELVTDDILTLEQSGDDVLAHPGPPLMTLPSERAAGVGAILGEVGDEAWVAAPVVSDPVPLRRFVLLDRRPGARAGARPIERPLAPLMKQMLSFPRTRERERERFLLASVIAKQVEMWQLVADVKTSPEQLAALALQGLDS